MSVPTRPARSLLGPVLVMTGASMWGLETFWRLRLSEHFDADVLVLHEHWLGLLLTLPFLALGWKKLRNVSAKAWISMLVSGVLGSAIGTVCFTQALTLMNPSVANVLLNFQPVMSVVAAWFWLGERPRGAFYVWAALAIACGAVLAWPTDGTTSYSARLTGLLYLAGTAFCWGVSTTAGRGALLEIEFKTAVTIRYAIGLAATFTIAAIRGLSVERLHFTQLFTRPVFVDMMELLIVAAVVPTFLYFAGLARTKASVATFAEMAQTFASLFITWYLLHHPLTVPQSVAGVVLLFAIARINNAMELSDAPVAANALAGQPTT